MFKFQFLHNSLCITFPIKVLPSLSSSMHVFFLVITGGIHWSLSDGKYLWFLTLFCILANLNCAIVRIVSIFPQIYIGLAVRVFANGPGDLDSIPGRVIPKTQKMVLDASLLNTQHYKVRIKGKVEQSREGVVPSPTPWCSSYRKGSLRVTLDYGRQLYLQFCSFFARFL